MQPDSSFTVIPAIDIQDGEVVQLVQGERGTERRYGDPVSVANRWIDAGADRLHLVDLDGAFAGGRENAQSIESIVDSVSVPLQLGGGIRSARAARSILTNGIDQVILGTAAIEDPSIVREITETHPDSVIVSLDARDGEVVVEGWTEETGLDPVAIASRYESLGAAGILFTDVDVEGRLEGVRTTTLAELVEAVEIPVIASGGVSSLDDIAKIQTAGAAAVVVGTALYEGKFTLADAIDAV